MNSMVPATNWANEAQQFASGLEPGSPEPQQMLCFQCVLLGMTTPPRYVVVFNGTSLCLEHLDSERRKSPL